MDISAMLSLLSSAKDLGGLLIAERDAQKAAVIKAELTEKILEAQAQFAQVLGAVIEKDAAIARLAQRVSELEAAQSEKDRYELAMLEPSGNAFAYRLRPAAELSERQAEPVHFLCQPCFDLGRKSVLTRSDFYGRYVFKCSGCKTDFDGGVIGGQ